MCSHLNPYGAIAEQWAHYQTLGWGVNRLHRPDRHVGMTHGSSEIGAGLPAVDAVASRTASVRHDGPRKLFSIPNV
jgi:hypothetical protein